jgi:hypothetical protein
MNALRLLLVVLVLSIASDKAGADDKPSQAVGFTMLEDHSFPFVVILKNGDMYKRFWRSTATFMWMGDSPHFFGNFWTRGSERLEPPGRIVGLDYAYNRFFVMLEDGTIFSRGIDTLGVHLADKVPEEEINWEGFWGSMLPDTTR